jgi:hypothetical protein
MGFFSDLFGGASGKKAANAAAEAQSAYINTGYDKAEKATGQGYSDARGYIDPYIQSGRRASTSYENALGLNGRGGFDEAQGQFDMYSAPEQAATRNALGATLRRYNAGNGGGGNSGGLALATARTYADRYNQYRQQWLDRVQGQGQQGWQASQAGAGLATDYGNRTADYALGRATGLANTETQRQQNIYQAGVQGQQNLMKGLGFLGGAAISGFTPGASGVSAFGNMASMFRGTPGAPSTPASPAVGGGGANALFSYAPLSTGSNDWDYNKSFGWGR